MNDYEQQLHNAWNRVTYNGATVAILEKAKDEGFKDE